jgi:hypothetical protein
VSRFPNSLEDIVSSAAKGGWEWFDAADDRIKDKLELQQAKDGADARVIAEAWARFYNSPDGRMALELLFDTTLRRTVFFVQLGLPPDQVVAFGAFREGQNALAHAIAASGRPAHRARAAARPGQVAG